MPTLLIEIMSLICGRNACHTVPVYLAACSFIFFTNTLIFGEIFGTVNLDFHLRSNSWIKIQI